MTATAAPLRRGLPHGIAVFSHCYESIQLSWRGLPPGDITLTCAEQVVVQQSPSGAGSATIAGLEPNTQYEITATQGAVTLGHLHAHTAPRPPGELLHKFATLSDLHLGRGHFGLTRRMRESDPDTPHTLRCSLAATRELLDWGAAQLIVKGDLVDSSREHAWAEAAVWRTAVTVPLTAICGNHEMAHWSTVDPFEEAQKLGFAFQGGVTTIDTDGLRLILMDSSVPNIDKGTWKPHLHEVVAALESTEQPAMLITHHQPNLVRRPRYLPLGIPEAEAREFLRTAARANRNWFGTSGHTHRHRRYLIEGVTWSEVGSPKDFPGTWAGYSVFESGVTQMVRRVEDPACIDWLDYTRRAALGAWALWSPGKLSDRCFFVPSTRR